MLSNNNKFAFKKHYRKKLRSTNIFLSRLLKSDELEEGYLISTDKQTRGIGQNNSFWESEPDKNLLFSFVLRPEKLELQKQFYLSIVVSLALTDLIKKYLKNSEICIKWPNDIYVDDRKIAGILIENAIQGTHFEWVIVGIGLNVNQDKFYFESSNPISLKQRLKEDTDREQLLDEFEVLFAKRYGQLNANKFDTLLSEYLELMYRRNKWQTYYAEGVQFQGIILGLDEFGFLRMETSNGEKTFDVKEVEYLS